MSLLIVGSMAFDGLETPFGKVDRIEGGAATYASLSASFLADKIGVISVIGDDFSREMVNELRNRGIDLSGVEMVEGGKTFFWRGRYHNDLNTRDTLATELNVLGDFKPVVPQGWKSPRLLMLGNLSPSVQLSVLSQLENRPELIAADTMNFWMDIALEELKEVLKKIDLLFVNDEEARQLSGEYSLRKSARIIQGMGPRIVVIKKGEHGALLFDAERVTFCPALPLEEVFDPTGAGDSFAGGFMGSLAGREKINHSALRRALLFGTSIASFCVEQFGPQRLLSLTRDEIDQRRQEIAELMCAD